MTILRMTAEGAQRRIRELAIADTWNIGLSSHAKERMPQREIFIQDLYEILRTGHCDDAPVRTEKGDWKCKMTKKIKGQRLAGAVTVIMGNQRLHVVTVEWEDEA